MITNRLAYSSIYSQKMEMNIVMEDASSLRFGCMVHYLCLWCTSIHRGYTSNILQRESGFISLGLFTWREGSHASRLTDTMGKGNFHIILLKTQRLFMLDKCFQKLKYSYEILWISWHI